MVGFYVKAQSRTNNNGQFPAFQAGKTIRMTGYRVIVQG